MNCGATVPRVSLENLRAAKITGLYCSRIGSTELRISSDAAYAAKEFLINKIYVLEYEPTCSRI